MKENQRKVKLSAVPEKKKSTCEASWFEADEKLNCKCSKRKLPKIQSDRAVLRKYANLATKKERSKAIKTLLTGEFASSA